MSLPPFRMHLFVQMWNDVTQSPAQKNEQIIDIAAKHFPQLKSKLPEIDISTLKTGDHFKTDVKKTDDDLGVQSTPFEVVIKDTIAKLLELEKELGA